MYLLALVCPPLAILLCGKPFQAMLSVPVSLCYFPAALWALLVVSDSKATKRGRARMRNDDRNTVAMVEAMERSSRAQVRAMERQTRELERAALGRDEPELIEVSAVARPKPAAISPPPSADVELTPVAPPGPRMTLSEAVEAARKAKDAALSAYRELPEWAQPITWGLAAASPVSAIIAFLFLMR